MRVALFLLFVSLPFLPAPAVAGAAVEQYDYRRLYELLYQFEILPPPARDRLAFSIRLSDDEGRVPEGLRVFIRYGEREIPVPVDEFGLLDLPFSPQLASISAPVITNQPEDSLRLGFTMVIRQPRGGALDVDWLLAGMQQAGDAMRARARIADNLVPEAVGVTLKFAGNTRGRVIIAGDSGEVEYRADDYNTVDIPLDPSRPPERIEITDQPLVIFPLFRD